MQMRNGVKAPPTIIRDGAFPFRSWLLKPYGHPVLPEEERYYNFRLSRARMVSEIAFDIFKKQI